ncbi:HAD family hydrolase [Mediterraneibacter gnavus]|jgi:hypothetical protein|uniref:Phosphatase YwpJ n=1 Tax=Mediterraneibacter gnavus TaxID=33038 RepID=A0A6N3A0C6_MEDGN|nr:HAD family hydrolase [Mediterraneibacter gnavus]
MIKLLAIDMDGTCLNSRSHISAQTLTALHTLAKSGTLIVPTTGRALTCLPHQLTDQNSLFRYVISSNGAKVTDYHTQKTLYQSEIPKQTALSLLNACQSEKLGITAHIRHEYLLQGHSLVFLGRLIYGKDARKVRYVQNMEQTIQELSCDVKELQFYFFPKTPCRSSKCILQTPRLFVLPAPVSMQRSFHQNPPKGRSDASGQSLGIAKSEIACIGD